MISDDWHGYFIETKRLLAEESTEIMTEKLSLTKVKKILQLLFRGCPQAEIAAMVGVDQSTVSLYAGRFRDRCAEIGMAAASEELGMYDEISLLRSLAVELLNCGMTVVEAQQGLHIFKTFHKLGVSQEKHEALVQACGQVQTPGFVAAVIRLVEIEMKSGMTADQVVDMVENMQRELPQLNKETKQEKAKLQSISSALAAAKKKLAEAEKDIAALEERHTSNKADIEQELGALMDQLGVSKVEVQQVRELKERLHKTGVTIELLITLAKEFPHG